MKKIALVIDTWFPTAGGGQSNAYEITKRITGRDYRVDVITRNCGADVLKMPRNMRVIKLGSIQNPNSVISKMVFLIRSFLFLLRNNYDLLHAHAYLPGISVRLVSTFIGIPTVFTVHGTSLGSGLNNWFMEAIERWVLTGILYDAQITVSRDFLRLKNINKNIAYINNGISARTGKNGSKKPKNQTLLFVGRLHKQKNVDTLLRAFPSILNQFPETDLMIAGDGPESQDLKSLSKKLKIGKHITFLGNVDKSKLAKLYQTSTLLILPSIYEGTPLVLLEAWVAKLPVIVSATGDSPFLIKEGNNGFIIDDPLDEAQVVATVKKALNCKNLSKVGQNGYNFVTKNFSWDKSAEQTKTIYDSLIKTQN